MALAEVNRGDGSLAMGLLHITLVVPIGLLLYIYSYHATESINPKVKISTGNIEGIVGVSRDGKMFAEFLGIPYARPPIGELRFQAPQPPLNWDGYRSAGQYGPKCTQIEFFTKKLLGQEDCLYLNVFTPKIGSEPNQTPLLPVLVYLHGGYFMSGASNAYRPEYLLDHSLILVTLNYRTGALGFLNTGDNIVRGNMGLKDQNMALRWIQTNIASFGGDPHNVILFGNSAGSASVHFHVISPMSKGLFKKVICESGSAVKIWSFVSQPADQAKRLGKQLDCPTTNSTVLVKCLQNLDANTITAAHWEYLDIFLDPLAIYAPSVEGSLDENTFLSEHPLEILKKGQENKVRAAIFGLSSDEGLLFTARILANKDAMNTINTNWKYAAPLLLGYSEDPRKDEISNKVQKFYLGDRPNISFERNFHNFTNMLSDRLYFTATQQSILLQRRFSPIFPFYYTYCAQFSFASILQLSGKVPAFLEIGYDLINRWIRKNILQQNLPELGVSHGDELIMLFDLGFLSNIREGHKDYKMSKAVVKLWSDFAHSEAPEFLEFENIKWRPSGKDETPIKYLNLDSTPSIIDEPFSERVNFWNSLELAS